MAGPNPPDAMDTETDMDTQIPLPALDILTSEHASKIAVLVEQSLAPLLAEADRAKALDVLVDEVAVFYQQKLHQCLTSTSAAATLNAARERETSQTDALAQMVDKVNDLRARDARAAATMSSLREENESLRKRISERDETIAADAHELARLRPHALASATLRTVQSERDTLRDTLRRETERRESLDEAHTAATRALRTQVATLTGELSSAHAESASLRSSHESSIATLEGRVRDAERREGEMIAERKRMEAVVERLSKEVEETKAAAKQLNDSFKTEVEHLEKMCELHEGRVKESEARASDCEEALKQERELGDMRARKLEGLLTARNSLGMTTDAGKTGADLAPHVQTLLSGMEKALSDRWELMERQKEEVDRARQTEMRAVAGRERLERELIDVRAKADGARREATRYAEQVERQAEEIGRLEKQAGDAQRMLMQQVEQANRLFASPGGVNPTPLRLSYGSRPSLTWMPAQQQQLQQQDAEERVRQSTSPGQMQMQMPMAVDIGPSSVIPTDMFASPTGVPGQQRQSADFSMSLREMSEIRKRHERVLETLRDNRVSMG